MDAKTLEMANNYQDVIDQCKRLLMFFDYDDNDDLPKPLNTKIYLGYEGQDLLASMEVPGDLSKELKDVMRQHITRTKEGYEMLLEEL